VPLTSGRTWGGIAAAAKSLDISEEPLTDRQVALVLGFQNWLAQGFIASDQDPIRHYIAGALAEAAMHVPPLEIWVGLLHKQLQKKDRPIRFDTLASHVDALVAAGICTSRIDEHRRRAIAATPAFVERARRRAALKLAMMRATVLAVDHIGDRNKPFLFPGGPLDRMAGSEDVGAPAPADDHPTDDLSNPLPVAR
jgi:hypothetical protein